ncbi:bZIP transcription factor 46-like [Andrographis paniculata]|uniref:bZIP transcription factor 46-like n=1 Tax=Andrographis paniculata TaxID=175694 RepID=UPI0021E72BDC|nr:bZIP transcription factor 46-like [Andrographis paniculata]
MEDIWKDLTTLPSASSAAAAAPPPYQDHLHLGLPNNSNTATTNETSSSSPTPPFALNIGTYNCPKYSDQAVERKRKRLIKNRESAVRSRARRQAYTYHLEAKILLLKEENAELKKLQKEQEQQQQQQQPQHHKEDIRPKLLQRAVTAPF